MRTLLLHIDLAFSYLAKFIKTRWEYKADLLIGLATGLLFQGITLIFLDVLFKDRSLTVNGWTRDQVLFIYGFSIFPQNLFFTFFTNLYNVGSKYVIDGNLDRILLRPLHSLYQVLLEDVNIESMIGMIIGAAIVWYSSAQLGIEWSLGKIILLTIMALAGALIYGGIFTVFAALSFWWPDRVGLMAPLFNMTAFSKYPITIYHPLLQYILMWIIPFAFVAFFPSTYFLQREDFHYYVLLIPVVACASMAAGLVTWNLGIRHYESTGN